MVWGNADGVQHAMSLLVSFPCQRGAGGVLVYCVNAVFRCAVSLLVMQCHY